MVRPTVDQLKGDAFKLSKILATFKVKLSSQQCLDALARLQWNLPYEALLARRGALVESENKLAAAKEPNALAEWLRCGQAFCDVVKTLDREGVNQAAWPGHEVLERGLHWDGKSYLRAAAVAAHSFSKTAEAFVLAQSAAGCAGGLTFSVEASEPISYGQLATLRIQSRHSVPINSPAEFIGLGLLQKASSDFLYGAEARIGLTTWGLAPGRDGPYTLTPGLLLTYRVSGQHALGAFTHALEAAVVQRIWKVLGPLEVTSRVLLTSESGQDCIEDTWETSEDLDGQRLLKFCREASQLGEEETRDWPPYLEFHAALDATSNESDLERLFYALCALTLSIPGGGQGWDEILESVKHLYPQQYEEIFGNRSMSKQAP